MNIEHLKKSIYHPKPFGLVGYLEYFAATELCSHVRFCRLDYDAPDYFREDALAWCFIRGDISRVDGWQSRIGGIEFEEIHKDRLKDLVTGASASVDKSEHITVNPKLPISSDEVGDVSVAWEVRNFNQYQYGPTYIVLSETKNTFWYLEEHLES